jgi:GT2 family glycosyltransferase
VSLPAAPARGAALTSGAGAALGVCLLTYNHVAVVGSTLDSVLDQTLAGFELIVSDDCSTDGTWELLCERAARDPRIRAMRTPKNLGMAGNANFAARHSQRPYLALLHHDDLYRRDLLARWQAVLDRHPDVGFVFNAYRAADGRHMGHDFSAERLDGTWFLERQLLPHWGCPVRGTALIRRSAWEALGGMREQFGLLADVDLWMRLAARGPVGYVPEALITVRHERPPYYPAEYQSSGWSWRRQRHLYEIHAQNWIDHYCRATARHRLARLEFRTRLSLETAKWLAYALLRRRWPMLDGASESSTPHDQLWLRGLRRAVCQVAALVRSERGPA